MAKMTAKLAKIKRHEAIFNKIPTRVGQTVGTNMIIRATPSFRLPLSKQTESVKSNPYPFLESSIQLITVQNLVQWH